MAPCHAHRGRRRGLTINWTRGREARGYGVIAAVALVGKYSAGVLRLLHGMNGLRVVADDLIHSGGWRTVATATIYLVTFVFLVIGSQAVLTFQPIAAP